MADVYKFKVRLCELENVIHEAVVEVVNIEYFSKKNAPLPIEKTKNILRKCMDEEI